MQSLFITATNTDIGKTYTTLKLIDALSSKGYRVGIFKPIETGVTGIAPDAEILLEKCQNINDKFKSMTPNDITAYTFSLPAAPFCADREKVIEIDHILHTYHSLSKKCDILIVEGAGGLLVPITESFTMIDLAKKLGSKVLLVTPSSLGCINDTLLSIEALRSREIDFDWCVNLYEDKETFAEVTQPYYDATFPDWWTVEEGLQRFITRNLI